MITIRKFGFYLIYVFITLWFLTRVFYPASITVTHGFAAYYTAAHLLVSGRLSARVYEPAYFRPLVQADSNGQADDIYSANPPTTALLFWPLSGLPVEIARRLWIAASTLFLLTGLAVLVFTFDPAARLPSLALAWGLGLLFQPAVANLQAGQAYLLIFLLLALTVAALWPDQAGPAGLTLALALLLKTAGWALLPLLTWQRRWRVLAVTLAGAAALWLLSLPWLPLAMWPAYLKLFGETGRSPLTCVAAYQTTRSLLCRLFVFEPTWSPAPLLNAPWLASGLLLALALLTLGLTLALSGRDPNRAAAAAVAWGVLFAPLGEQYHHTVLLIPLTWLLLAWRQGRLSRGDQVVLAVAVLLYLVPLPNPDYWPTLLAYPRVYGAWLTFLLLYRK